MTPDEELNRAELAKQILDNPLVKDVLANLEREIIEGWIATSYKDETAREKAWMWANIVRKFRNTFESYITTKTEANHPLLLFHPKQTATSSSTTPTSRRRCWC